MIIEEQMDKIVTKGDLYQKDESRRIETKNTVYAMDDGSSILEREAPCPNEAITTTTIAKERFIVRPLDGDIYSKWMDVTHTVVDNPNLLEKTFENNLNKAKEAIHGENESIMLDISGYKTQQEEKDDSSSDDDDSPSAINSLNNTNSVATPATSNADTVDNDENKAIEVASSWGWGKPHAEVEREDLDGEENANGVSQLTNPVPNIKEPARDSDTVQLKAGHTYRVEMGLCGFAEFGYDEHENDFLFQEKQVSYDSFVHNPSMLNDPRLVFRYNKHYFAAVHSSPLFTSLLIFKHPLKDKEAAPAKKVQNSRDTYSYGRGWRQWLSRSSSADCVSPLAGDDDQLINNEHESTTAINEKIDDPSNKELTESERTTFTTTTKTTSVGWSPDHNHETVNNDPNNLSTPRKMCAKTLRLTSDQLKSLNLKKGVNTISFSVKSAYQGTATCVAKVFYWDYDIQVVISDIDGTITKSDTMGHLMTMIGKDWTHQGVAQLYTDIANNGYHFMYLTSRAIGQADYTRDHLKKVLQGNYQLPDGPVIMSPDRLFTSLHREVIMRKPEMFKMACLKDIQQLFGDRDPFYAGFGNRITDAISYRSVNMPSSRIFTIDPQGDLKLELITGFRSTYTLLNGLVNQIFPPIDKTINEEYTDYNYWKTLMPEIDIPELEEEGPIPTSPKPKPIVPDPSNSLPKESIVAYIPERKRGLLSGFRSSSRSSVSLTKSSPPASSIPSLAKSSTSPTTNTLLPPNRALISSASAPILSVDLKLDETYNVNSNTSSLLSSPYSLPVDHNPTENDSSGTSTSAITVTTRQRSSSSIISRVMGSAFFRSSVSPPTKPIDARDNIKKESKEEEEAVEDNTQGEEEDDDDDLLNQEIDYLDLSKMPFI